MKILMIIWGVAILALTSCGPWAERGVMPTSPPQYQSSADELLAPY